MIGADARRAGSKKKFASGIAGGRIDRTHGALVRVIPPIGENIGDAFCFGWIAEIDIQRLSVSPQFGGYHHKRPC